MVLRTTTGGVLRGYRSNLQKSFNKLTGARNTVLTNRLFNSYAEDPSAASQSFRLRRSRMRVESQYTVNNATLGKYQAAWTSLDTVDKLIDTENNSSTVNNLKNTTLKALNDPTGDAREQLSKNLKQISDTIVQVMNNKYGDNFVFAGADGANVPFEVRDDGKLYYRGVPVDAAKIEVAGGDDAPITVDANGNYDTAGTNYLKADSVSVMSKADYDKLVADAKVPNVTYDANNTAPLPVDVDGKPDPNGEYYYDIDNAVTVSISDYNAQVQKQENLPKLLTDGTNPVSVNEDGTVAADQTATPTHYLVVTNAETVTKDEYDTAKSDAEKLEYLANEKYFVDIGLGYKENENGELIESSGFNAALNGINFIGYGLDEDGDPRNVYSLAQKMGEIAARVGEKDWSEADYEEFRGLVGKLEKASSEFKTQFTNQSAATTKLTTNGKLLEEQHYTLQEQYSELEDVDMADAITSFLWAQYSYNAALKVGNSILSQSLMDYMS